MKNIKALIFVLCVLSGCMPCRNRDPLEEISQSVIKKDRGISIEITPINKK